MVNLMHGSSRYHSLFFNWLSVKVTNLREYASRCEIDQVVSVRSTSNHGTARLQRVALILAFVFMRRAHCVFILASLGRCCQSTGLTEAQMTYFLVVCAGCLSSASRPSTVLMLVAARWDGPQLRIVLLIRRCSCICRSTWRAVIEREHSG